MRFYLVLGLSALAVAGPIPSYSNNTTKDSAAPSIPANISLTFDPVATLNILKTIYDSLNETERNTISNLQSDFLTWLDDTVETSGLHGRSSDSIPANVRLDPESIQALTRLKAIYDSHNGTDHNALLKVKRDFLEGFADLHPGSTDSTSLKEKRGFKQDVKEGWDWLKDTFKAPGLGARSTAIYGSRNGADHHVPLKVKRESLKQRIKDAIASFVAILKAGPYHN